MGSGLGVLITEEGEVSLERIILAANAGLRSLHSRGFEPARVRARARVQPKSGVKSGHVRVLTREEIMLEEIFRFAKNKTMIIIGLVMIMVECEYFFYDIEEAVLHNLIMQAGFEDISLTDVKKVMTRIDNSDLVEELICGNRIGLNRAYQLYLGK